MTAGPSNGEPTVGADVPRLKSFATADTLATGCIAWVNKDGQPRRAEILSIKQTKSGKQFYCNFDNFNKRLDEWVPLVRIDFSQEVEWPNPEKDKPKETTKKKVPSGAANKKSAVSKKNQKRPGKREDSIKSEATTPHPWSGTSISRLHLVMPRTNTARLCRVAAQIRLGRPRWRLTGTRQRRSRHDTGDTGSRRRSRRRRKGRQGRL